MSEIETAKMLFPGLKSSMKTDEIVKFNGEIVFH